MKLTDRQREKLRELNALRDEYESLFAKVVGDGIEDGSIRGVPVEIGTRTLLGGLNAVNVWYRYRDGAEPDKDELVPVIAELLVGGFSVSR
jgi:hypothetical protein